MTKRVIAVFALILACGVAGFVGGLAVGLDVRVPPPTVGGTILTTRVRVAGGPTGGAVEITAAGIELIGMDGQRRAVLFRSYNDKPYLLLSDGEREGRLILGFIGSDTPSPRDNDFGLIVYGPEGSLPVVDLAAASRRK